MAYELRAHRDETGGWSCTEDGWLVSRHRTLEAALRAAKRAPRKWGLRDDWGGQQYSIWRNGECVMPREDVMAAIREEAEG